MVLFGFNPRYACDANFTIFIRSQFKIMLDIIEDYLHLREYKCERIDGSITGLKRQAAIDRFQGKSAGSGREPPFIMLLSTRAGGVGKLHLFNVSRKSQLPKATSNHALTLYIHVMFI